MSARAPAPGWRASSPGCCFLLAMFLAPLVTIVPYEAATPALVVVGFLMMTQVQGHRLGRLRDRLPGVPDDRPDAVHVLDHRRHRRRLHLVRRAQGRPWQGPRGAPAAVGRRPRSSSSTSRSTRCATGSPEPEVPARAWFAVCDPAATAMPTGRADVARHARRQIRLSCWVRRVIRARRLRCGRWVRGLRGHPLGSADIAGAGVRGLIRCPQVRRVLGIDVPAKTSAYRVREGEATGHVRSDVRCARPGCGRRWRGDGPRSSDVRRRGRAVRRPGGRGRR